MSETLPATKPVGYWRKLAHDYSLLARFGGLVLGVTLPTLLVSIHHPWTISVHHIKEIIGWSRIGWLPLDPDPRNNIVFLIKDMIRLQVFATIGCGLGAVFLSSMLFDRLSDSIVKKSMTREQTIMRGMLMGAGAAFFNLPGYLVALFLNADDPLYELRIVLLFAVSGASAGWWIAWQALRSTNNKLPVFPQLSMRGLLAGVMAWGGLMALFAPAWR